jgi:murein DD-endopeptidase MepM/ murein hydrolase activator NlpD
MDPHEERRPDSMPILDVMLDPIGGDASSVRRAPRSVSPNLTALAGALLGLALIGALFVVLMRFARPPPPAPATVPSPTVTAAPALSALRAEPSPTTPTMPGPWRVAELASDPAVRILHGTMERRSFIDALATSGVPQEQVYRLIGAFRTVRRFDKTRRKDTFVVALDADTRKIRAFEYEAGPTEIYQAREQDDGALAAERLDLHVEKKSIAGAVVVGDDPTASLRTAGFDPSLLERIEDALDGRAQLSGPHAGARLRILAEEETALGAFARYTELPAIEYVSPEADTAPLRVYHYEGRRAQGYFDAKGRQPYKGGFRAPVPFVRISSHFDMHRMHPILHVVRPHNGVDFAAPTGTPVYAAHSGRVLFVGDAGASGNLVTIQHTNDITTGYAHLSRFAPRLAQGQQVETRQLIGYVGSTGRSTGAHLHFSAKKKGVFIDPLALRLDGERVLPKPDREPFEQRRAALDGALDAVPLPSAPERASPGEVPGTTDEPLELDPDDVEP